MTTKYKIVTCMILIVLAGHPLLGQTASTAGRRISIGDKIPEFSATDAYGKLFDYKHGRKKVLVVVFLSVSKKQSDQAATDIKRIMSKLRSQAKRLNVVVALDDPNNHTFVRSKQNSSEPNEAGVIVDVVADTEYKLWGKFGIIATPTVIISDTNDNVLWVKAGHGYDFAPVVKARLNQALGIEQEIDPNEAGRVRTVTNATVAARVKRYLQMAKMLQKKGRIESAITQLKKARELDPNSVEVVLELGTYLCKVGQSKAALDAIDEIKTDRKFNKTRLLLISGWANRQLGELEVAEKLLSEVIIQNPKSSRAFFELGQIHQAKGQVERAMKSYYQALTLIFGREENSSGFHLQY